MTTLVSISYGRANWMTFDPDEVGSVSFLFAICAVILFWKREKYWEYRDELPLRITAAASTIFIYSFWWQEATHGWLWLYEAFTVLSALAIVAAMVMAFLNADAKFRQILLYTAPLPAALFLLFHTPRQRPAEESYLSPEIQQIIQKANEEANQANSDL